MDECSVQIDIIKGMKGVRNAFLLDEGILSDLKTEEATVRSTLDIGVVNEGFNEALEREYVICIVKDPRFRPPPEPTVVLKGDDGTIMGIEVFPHTAGEYKARDDVIWLSDGFVVFPDRKAPSEERFVMPPVSFPELNPDNGCADVVSCSPSPTSDVMIKEHYGLEDDPKLATILVAFNGC